MKTAGQRGGAFYAKKATRNRSRDTCVGTSRTHLEDRGWLLWLKQRLCVEKRKYLPRRSRVYWGESHCLAEKFECDSVVTTVVTTAGGHEVLVLQEQVRTLFHTHCKDEGNEMFMKRY